MAVDGVLDPGEMRVHVTHLDGSVQIAVNGELDLATVPQFWGSSAEVVGRVPSGSKLVLDAEGLDFLDAAGLGAIVRLGNCLRARGASLKVAGVRPPVQRVFELTGLEHLLVTPTPAAERDPARI